MSKGWHFKLPSNQDTSVRRGFLPGACRRPGWSSWDPAPRRPTSHPGCLCRAVPEHTEQTTQPNRALHEPTVRCTHPCGPFQKAAAVTPQVGLPVCGERQRGGLEGPPLPGNCTPRAQLPSLGAPTLQRRTGGEQTSVRGTCRSGTAASHLRS